MFLFSAQAKNSCMNLVWFVNVVYLIVFLIVYLISLQDTFNVTFIHNHPGLEMLFLFLYRKGNKKDPFSSQPFTTHKICKLIIHHKKNGILSLLVGHVNAVELFLPIVRGPQPFLQHFPGNIILQETFSQLLFARLLSSLFSSLGVLLEEVFFADYMSPIWVYVVESLGGVETKLDDHQTQGTVLNSLTWFWPNSTKLKNIYYM